MLSLYLFNGKAVAVRTLTVSTPVISFDERVLLSTYIQQFEFVLSCVFFSFSNMFVLKLEILNGSLQFEEKILCLK